MRPCCLLVCVLLGLVLALGGCRLSAPASQPGPVTVDWLYSEDGKALARVPAHAWTREGRLLLRDPGQADASAVFEVLQPATGERQPAFDTTQALASLQTLLGDKAPEKLGWPQEFDAAGQQALYLFTGDLFVLDLLASRFRRLTTTEEVEKSARFSPDGRAVAFVRDNDLYVHSLAQGAELRLTHDGTDNLLNGTLSWVYWEEIFGRQDLGYWWSPDSRHIAFLQSDESEVTQVEFTDFQPAVPRVIRQRYPKAGTKNPTVRAGVVSATGGEVQWLALEPSSYEYLVRLKWLPDSQRLAFQTLNRAQDRLDLYFVGAGGGPATRILTETDPAWVNVHDDLYFLEDGRHFLWVSERSGHSHLYRYLMDGTPVNAVTEGDWALRSSSSGVFWLRQAVCHVDDAAGQVYFTALKDGSVERHLYRTNLDGSGLERLSKEAGTHQISFSPNGAHYLDRYSQLDRLPALYLESSQAGPRQVLAPGAQERLVALDVQCPRPFIIPAADGFEMPALLTRPRDFDPSKRYPVILNLYAGPSAPTVRHQWLGSTLFDQVLLDRGFLVLRVDNRSATAVSKHSENTILHRMSGAGELNDIIDAVQWIKQQPYVDPDRVGLWGWSGGGTATLLCMTRSQEFKAGIAVAAVTDWRFYDTRWTEFVMKRPEDNPEGYEKTNLVRRAQDLHGNLLLVHGTYDDNVHPQNVWAFSDALIAAGKPFDMMIYPMRKHGISDDAARRHLFHKMAEFWSKNL